MAANFQGFARSATDYASADLIWRAPERAAAAGGGRRRLARIDCDDLGYDHAARGSALGIAPAANDAPGAGLNGVSLALAARRADRAGRPERLRARAR